MSTNHSANEARAQAWKDLLMRLTQASPRWAATGNVEEGFRGEGDIDVLVRKQDWPQLQAEWRRWASDRGLGTVITCRHRPGVLILVALAEPGVPFFELEVVSERYFRGSVIYTADDVSELTDFDPGGWRRLRPGAAGLLKLFPNGISWDGRLKWKGLKAQRIAELLAGDPEGVRAAAALFGSAEGAVRRAAQAAAAGEWDRRSVVAVEIWAALRSLRRPYETIRRAGFRFDSNRRCIVRETVRAGRIPPSDTGQWLQRVAAEHAVEAVSAGSKPPSPRGMS